MSSTISGPQFSYLERKSYLKGWIDIQRGLNNNSYVYHIQINEFPTTKFIPIAWIIACPFVVHAGLTIFFPIDHLAFIYWTKYKNM